MGVLAFGCSASYTIDVARPDGGVTRISRAWDPPVRTDEEHEAWSEGFLVQNMRRVRDKQILARLGRVTESESIQIPPIPILPRERPAFLRLWHTEDGRIWAWPGAAGWSRPWTEEERRSRQQRPGGEVILSRRFWTYWNPTDGFDVFDTDGRWIGHVNTPESWAAPPYPGRNDPYFQGDTIWALLRDELDVSYIARFEVEWSSPD